MPANGRWDLIRRLKVKVSAVAREDSVGVPDTFFMTTYTSMSLKFTSRCADARALLPSQSDQRYKTAQEWKVTVSLYFVTCSPHLTRLHAEI